MNNIITENYVSFEISKLLKEKGFDVHCDSYYEEDKSLHQFVGNYNSQDQKPYLPHYSRPTQALAIKWIRENTSFLDIWIEPYLSKEPKKYTPCIWFRGGYIRLNPEETFEKAESAVILYTLQNLIP